ncbi:cytochrome c oxidase subunit 5B, mitochondrial-like [Amphiura filiformis]|uniref:cytochrome c oxidase subunit 5B, mitochondrial-like n=1 Tax=Amphiura filiformis TaxID=82378 RepID=UPI003B215434
MASLMVARIAGVTVRRCVLRPNVRTMARATIPGDFEHATGLDKKEQELRTAESDPFKLQIQTPPSSVGASKTNPNLIPSAFTKRIVGCICEDEQTFIKWMWLYDGEPQRCDCGRWFKLTQAEPVQ